MALMCFAKVDFPEPLCPRIATKSPRFMSKLIWSRAQVIPSTFPSSSLLIYSNTRSLASISPILYPLLFILFLKTASKTRTLLYRIMVSFAIDYDLSYDGQERGRLPKAPAYAQKQRNGESYE